MVKKKKKKQTIISFFFAAFTKTTDVVRSLMNHQNGPAISSLSYQVSVLPRMK
jgi:hypothetical protein